MNTLAVAACFGCVWTSTTIDAEREAVTHTHTTGHATIWHGTPAALTIPPPVPNLNERSLIAPAGTGRGLNGPACPWRVYLDQQHPTRPLSAMCAQCGRVTARRDSNGLPWCGGLLPALAPTPSGAAA